MKTTSGLFLVLLTLLASSPAMADLKVVATLPDLAALAQEVGGDRVEVMAMASPREDPHYVDPRPSHILALNKADLLIVNGLGLEVGWLPPLQSQARNSAINVGGAGFLDASESVSLLGGAGEVDRSEGDVHSGGNPHFLLDPRRAARVAVAIGNRMAVLDPDFAGAYQKRAADCASALLGLAQRQRERFAALPAGERRMIGYHRSLLYLSDWLMLEEVATIEPKPGVAPTPRHVSGVLQAMRGKGVRLIVQESFYPQKTSQTLARMGGAQLVVLDGGTAVGDGEKYLKHMEKMADAIFVALQR